MGERGGKDPTVNKLPFISTVLFLRKLYIFSKKLRNIALSQCNKFGEKKLKI